MKRGWIGLGMLLALLVAGILVTWWMVKSHERISLELDRAAGYALTENWVQADHHARKAKNQWEKGWHLAGAFADHEPMESIDDLFAQLPAYLAARDPVSFAAVCAQLSRQVQAVGEAHGMNWWNLL